MTADSIVRDKESRYRRELERDNAVLRSRLKKALELLRIHYTQKELLKHLKETK